MPNAAFNKPEASTLERIADYEQEFPGLSGECLSDGKVRISLKNKASFIWVDYHRRDATDGDAWRYALCHATSKTEFAGTFSHPTELGCWIAARKYFAENNLIPIPQDNAHLSEQTFDIYLSAETNRSMRRRRANCTPEVGDFIRDLDGDLRRVCHSYDDRCQTTTALERSYYTSCHGGGSYSGSLGSSVSFSALTKADRTHPGMFWTFRDGRAGAGRGVDLWLDVAVWTYDGVFSSDELWWGR